MYRAYKVHAYRHKLVINNLYVQKYFYTNKEEKQAYISPLTMTSFTVTYSFNWDGGDQELQTAMQAVKDVFPDAEVTPHGVNKYPIKVIITANSSDGNKTKVWSGRQQDLFRKNASKRTQTIEEIKKNLMAMA